jgi:hypothetical protein
MFRHHAHHVGKTCHTLIGDTLLLWDGLRRNLNHLITNPATSTSAMDLLPGPPA